MLRSHVSMFLLAVAFVADPATGQWFTDATTAAGVGGPYVTLASDDSQAFHCAGLGSIDWDDDGDDDLFVFRGSGRACAMFDNNGDGTFTDIAPQLGLDIQAPISNVSWCDYDNDGDPDLFLGTYEDVIQVGVPLPGGYKEIYLPGGNLGVSATGANNTGEFRNFVFRNDGTTFTEVAEELGVKVGGRYGSAFGDLDGDGWLDYVTVSHNSGENWIFRNRGGKSFTNVTPDNFTNESNPLRLFAPRLADYDKDGDLDILVAGDFITSQLYRNDGGWQFVNVTQAVGVGLDENGMGSTIGDFNNDGWQDWYVTAIWTANPESQPGNKLYYNLGNGTFVDITVPAGVANGAWGWGASFLDFDKDGYLDIAHTNGWKGAPWQTDTNRFFHNNGNATFTNASAAAGINDTGNGRGLVVFDYDLDGDQDIAINNLDTGLTLYRNDFATSAHYVEICLRGTDSNTYGIGASVEVTVGGMPTQTRIIEHGDNYLSQNPPTAFFGLGQTTDTQCTVEVEWPSGAVRTYQVDVDGRVVLDEAAGAPVR